MPVLKLLVDKSLDEKKFFNEIYDRTKVEDMTKNPFKAEMKIISYNAKALVLLDLEPIYPKMIPKIGVFLMAVAVIFGWKGTAIAGAFLALTSFFWTDWFFFLVLKRARKKKGLTGEMRLLKNREAFQGVMRAWDK